MPCPSESPGPRSAARWSNYLGNINIPLENYCQPRSLAELVRDVVDAEAAGKELHAVGAGYSFESIASSNDWMVDLRNLRNRIPGLVDNLGSESALTEEWQARQRGDDDSPLRLVHTEAGVRLFDLFSALATEGLGPVSVGGATGQTLAGATATSTHGSEPTIGALSDQIQAVHLVSTGGQEFWIERRSAPVTRSDDALRRAVPGCTDIRIIRDDEIFNSVIVSAGRFGIIYSLVFSVVNEMRVAEFGIEMSTAEVLRVMGTAEEGFVGQIAESVPDPPEHIRSIINDVRSYHYFDFIMNSRRPEKCIVRRRWLTTSTTETGLSDNSNFLCAPAIANAVALAAAAAFQVFAAEVGGVPFVGIAKAVQAQAKSGEMLAMAINADLSGGAAMAAALNGMWEIQFEDWLEEPINLLTDLAYNMETANTRSSGRVGRLWQVAAGTADPSSIGSCYRGNSIEIIFPSRSIAAARFLNFLRREAPNHRQAGYIAVRFTNRSPALLSMFQDASESGKTYISIEVTSLHGLQGNDDWFRLVERRAIALGGRPHWGQQNNLTASQVRALYPATLDRWRRACGSIVGTSLTFSNAFTRQRGLEPMVVSPDPPPPPMVDPTPDPVVTPPVLNFEWTRIGTADDIVGLASSGGKLFAATDDHQLLTREATLEDSSWRAIGHAYNVTAMASANDLLFCVTDDGRLWSRAPGLSGGTWRMIGRADGVIGLAGVGERLFAATESNRLLHRPATSSSAPWQPMGHARGVTDMDAVGGLLYCVTHDDRLWSRPPELSDTNWTEIGTAYDVVALTGEGDHLFAVTHSNELWSRPIRG